MTRSARSLTSSMLLSGTIATVALGFLGGMTWQDPGQPDSEARVVDQDPVTDTRNIDVREIHVLRVEFQRDADTGRFRILVDGDPVSTSLAAALNRHIRATRGEPFWNLGGDSKLEHEPREETIKPPPAQAGQDQQTRTDRVSRGNDEDRAGFGRDRGDGMFGGRGFGFGERDGARDESDEDRRSRWGRFRELDAETIAELMQIISDVEPDMYQRLVELEALDTERYMDFLKRRSGRYMGLLWIKRINEDHYVLKVREYELNRTTLDLQIQYQQAMDAKKTGEAERVQSELQLVVQEHFDNRQKQREYELAGMRQRLEDLEFRLKERLDSRDEIIGDRMEQLIANPAIVDF